MWQNLTIDYVTQSNHSLISQTWYKKGVSEKNVAMPDQDTFITIAAKEKKGIQDLLLGGKRNGNTN